MKFVILVLTSLVIGLVVWTILLPDKTSKLHATEKQNAESGGSDQKKGRIAEETQVYITPVQSFSTKRELDPNESALPKNTGAFSNRRMAILYFQNGNPEDVSLQPLQKGLCGMFLSKFSSYGFYELIEREEFKHLIDEQKLSNSSLVDPATANKIGRLLGANYLLLGSYFLFAENLRLDLRLVEVETGRTIVASGAEGLPKELGSMVQRLSAEIVTAHATKVGIAQTRIGSVALHEEETLEVVLAFGEAMELYDSGGVQAAINMLTDLQQRHPEFQAARGTLSAWKKNDVSTLGNGHS